MDALRVKVEVLKHDYYIEWRCVSLISHIATWKQENDICFLERLKLELSAFVSYQIYSIGHRFCITKVNQVVKETFVYCKLLYFHQHQFSSNFEKRRFRQYVNSSFEDYHKKFVTSSILKNKFWAHLPDVTICWL